MLFSEPQSGKLTKVIEPGHIEFFMHSEAAPEAEEIAKTAKVLFKEVY